MKKLWLLNINLLPKLWIEDSCDGNALIRMRAVFGSYCKKSLIYCRYNNWSICLKIINFFALQKFMPHSSSLEFPDIAMNVFFIPKSLFFSENILILRSINDNLVSIGYQCIVFCLYGFFLSISFLGLHPVFQSWYIWDGSFFFSCRVTCTNLYIACCYSWQRE